MGYYYGEPPKGRSWKVYLAIAVIAAILGMINELLGVIILVFGCYFAWVSS